MATFEQNLAEDAPRAEPAEEMLTKPAMNDGRVAGSPASLRVDVTGNTTLTFSSGGAGAEASSSSGGALGNSATGIKRPRLEVAKTGAPRAPGGRSFHPPPRPRLLERDLQAGRHGQGEGAQQKRHLPGERTTCRRYRLRPGWPLTTPSEREARHRGHLAAPPRRRPTAQLQPGPRSGCGRGGGGLRPALLPPRAVTDGAGQSPIR